MKFNLANLITGSRLGFVPVMLVLAWLGREQAFVICLTVSLVTDILDGKIARLLKQTSEFGTRLDSWADFSTYTTLPLCAYWMRPDLVAGEWVACVFVVASFAVPIGIGFAKFRQLTSYHTKMATVAAYCIGAATIVMFAHGPTWPFRLATAVLVLAELEEIAITLTLPRAHSNVASIRHARVLRAQMGR